MGWKRNIGLVAIVLIATSLVAGLIVLVLMKFTGDDNIPDNSVVESTEPPQTIEPTPTPTPTEDPEQQIIIEQDRTLVFDNIIKGQVGVDSGVVELTKDQYASEVNGAAITRGVNLYEETDGFLVVNSDTFWAGPEAGSAYSYIDDTCIVAKEIVVDKEFDDWVKQSLSRFDKIWEHESEWKLPLQVLTIKETPRFADPEWSFSAGDNINYPSQITGIGYKDYTELGYEKSLMVFTYNNNSFYRCECFLKVSDNRFMYLMMNGNPINFDGYVTEFLNNSLVVFK